MLVGDLIYNDSFDCNCDYQIYDCSDPDVQWGEAGSHLLFCTARDGFHKPLDKILDMEIAYITLHNSRLIIEAKKR